MIRIPFCHYEVLQTATHKLGCRVPPKLFLSLAMKCLKTKFVPPINGRSPTSHIREGGCELRISTDRPLAFRMAWAIPLTSLRFHFFYKKDIEETVVSSLIL